MRTFAIELVRPPEPKHLELAAVKEDTAPPTVGQAVTAYSIMAMRAVRALWVRLDVECPLKRHQMMFSAPCKCQTRYLGTPRRTVFNRESASIRVSALISQNLTPSHHPSNRRSFCARAVKKSTLQLAACGMLGIRHGFQQTHTQTDAAPS